MSKKIKVAVIGCGGIANGKHLPSLSQVEQVELVAFCDIIEERATKAAAEYGVEGAKVFTDFRKLLAETDVEVIHVCTPNDSHAEITVASLESGRHVMCEKPMAKTAEQARQIVITSYSIHYTKLYEAGKPVFQLGDGDLHDGIDERIGKRRDRLRQIIQRCIPRNNFV